MAPTRRSGPALQGRPHVSRTGEPRPLGSQEWDFLHHIADRLEQEVLPTVDKVAAAVRRLAAY